MAGMTSYMYYKPYYFRAHTGGEGLTRKLSTQFTSWYEVSTTWYTWITILHIHTHALDRALHCYHLQWQCCWWHKPTYLLDDSQFSRYFQFATV